MDPYILWSQLFYKFPICLLFIILDGPEPLDLDESQTLMTISDPISSIKGSHLIVGFVFLSCTFIVNQSDFVGLWVPRVLQLWLKLAPLICRHYVSDDIIHLGVLAYLKRYHLFSPEKVYCDFSLMSIGICRFGEQEFWVIVVSTNLVQEPRQRGLSWLINLSNALLHEDFLAQLCEVWFYHLVIDDVIALCI